MLNKVNFSRVLALGLLFVFLFNAKSLAVASTKCETSFKNPGPLGIPRWYKYLQGEEITVKKGSSDVVICKVLMYTTTATEIDSDPQTAGINLSKNIAAVGLAVIEILLRILVYIAIAWGIWGGYEIIVSGGNSQGFKNGINRVKNAAIGMVLGIISTPLITFVAGKII